MIRTVLEQDAVGRVEQDKIWKEVVERTGGRFYAAFNEESILQALRDIDRLTPGRSNVRDTASAPRFGGYALLAVALWLVAAAMKLTVPMFRTFP